MGCTTAQVSPEESQDVTVIDKQLQTLFNLSNANCGVSVAVSQLYETLNPIYENVNGSTDPVDVPMQPLSVWKANCPIALDILGNAGITYQLDTGAPNPLDTSKVDNLIDIHQSLERWLIDHDEYDLNYYGFSDRGSDEDTEDTENNAISECIKEDTNDASQNGAVKDTKLKPLSRRGKTKPECGHIAGLSILMRQLIVSKAMPLIVTNLIRNLQPPLTTSFDFPVEVKTAIMEFASTEVRINDAVISEDEAVEKCLDHFLHLKHVHDHEFDELLFPRLGDECVVSTCFMFKRNALRRMQDASVILDSDANQDIIDKIHCYFAHSYDCGHRLTKTEEESIVNGDNNDDEYISNDDDDFVERRFRNAKSEKLRALLAAKQQNISRIVGRLHNPISRFSTNFSESIIDDNQPLANSNASAAAEMNKFPAYSYGYSYVYHDIVPTDGDPYARTVSRNVTPKYKTLKGELLNHASAFLTIQQFHAEYDKARKHFRCSWGKQYIASHLTKSHMGWKEEFVMMVGQAKMTQKRAIFDVGSMQLWHVLSILLYCNFDALQNEVSKTYRKIHASEEEQDVLKRHSACFWFGKYLKAAVNSFGDVYQHSDSYNVTYFHGISTKMTFPQMFYRNGMRINGPLSTSPSFEVALNFAAQDGVVVEFKDLPSRNTTGLHVGGGHAVGSSLQKPRTYNFNCSWLSDFPSEKEHLFMQGGANLCMVNLTDMDNEYGVILRALAIIDSIMFTTERTDVRENENIINFANAIIEDKIAKSKQRNDLNFRMLRSLHEYATALINEWFAMRSNCAIDCSQWNEYKWIELHCLNILMPSLQQVTYSCVDIHQVEVMLAMVYQQWKFIGPSFQSLTLDVLVKGKVDAKWQKQIIQKYKKMFRDINGKIFGHDSSGQNCRIEIARLQL